jgi:hypothetical protein
MRERHRRILREIHLDGGMLAVITCDEPAEYSATIFTGIGESKIDSFAVDFIVVNIKRIFLFSEYHASLYETGVSNKAPVSCTRSLQADL